MNECVKVAVVERTMNPIEKEVLKHHATKDLQNDGVPCRERTGELDVASPHEHRPHYESEIWYGRCMTHDNIFHSLLQKIRFAWLKRAVHMKLEESGGKQAS